MNRMLLAISVAVLSVSTFISSPLKAAELLMLEQPGCYWCARFNAEIAPAYSHAWEGKAAPLRRIDITRKWPDDLKGIRSERLTPTFILIADGREIGRIRGYPGDNWFWSLVDEMLADIDIHAPS